MTESLARFPSYPAYKPSGVLWLGDIPAHWEVKRLKFGCRINPSKSEIVHLSPTFVVSFLPMENIGEDGKLLLTEARTLGQVGQGYTYFRNSDVIVAKITPCFENGKGALSGNLVGGIGFGTTELHVLRSNDNVDSRFVFYVTRSHAFRNLGVAMMYGAAGQQRVPENFVQDFRVAFPPLPEQRAIAAFLDRETAALDALIAKKEQLIQRLQEKRVALISRAVTKGLDPNARMKDSGVEWLGEAPEHWEVKRLKNIANVAFSNVDKHSLEGEQPVLLCNYVDVYKNEKITPAIDFMRATATKEEIKKFLLQRNDVIITKDSEEWNDIAVPAYVETNFEDVLCGYHLARVRPNASKIDGKFLFRAFQANAINYQFQIEATGITRYGIDQYAITNTIFLCPPIDEQRAIAAYLDRETEKIDALVAKIREGIARLREYRGALIAAAVTGKINVAQT